MSLPSFKPSQRRLLLGSAIALALFATPLSYDFDHHQWQVNQAHAKSCFIAGTRILMADGCERPIETLRIGDRVRDRHGQSNRIQAIERVALGGRRLYGLNHLPPFFTAEHPFLTTRGWAAIAPAMTRTENPALAVLPLFTGMHLLGWSEGGSAGNLALAPHPVDLPVASLSWVDAPPATALFNLILDGSHSYVANGLIVHNKGGDGGGNSGSGGGNSGGGGSNSGGGGNSSQSGNNSGNGGDSSHNGNNGGTTAATAAMTVVRANMPVATSTLAAIATAVATSMQAGSVMPVAGWTTTAWTPSTPMATSFEAMAAWMTTVWTPSMPMATSFEAMAAWMTTVWTPSTPMATSFEAMAAWTTTVWTPSTPMATSFGATAASMTAWCPRPLNRCQRPAPHTQQGRKQRGWPGPPSLFLWHRHARDTCGQVAPQTRRYGR